MRCDHPKKSKKPAGSWTKHRLWVLWVLGPTQNYSHAVVNLRMKRSEHVYGPQHRWNFVYKSKYGSEHLRFWWILCFDAVFLLNSRTNYPRHDPWHCHICHICVHPPPNEPPLARHLGKDSSPRQVAFGYMKTVPFVFANAPAGSGGTSGCGPTQLGYAWFRWKHRGERRWNDGPVRIMKESDRNEWQHQKESEGKLDWKTTKDIRKRFL